MTHIEALLAFHQDIVECERVIEALSALIRNNERYEDVREERAELEAYTSRLANVIVARSNYLAGRYNA